MMDEEEGCSCEAEKHACYEFNRKLLKKLDSGYCEHCRKYLTTECDKIDEFMGDIDELGDTD